jgi:hypothetical protein
MIPIVCWYDVKYRRVPLGVWPPLLLVTMGQLSYLYANGLPLYFLICGAFVAGLFFLMAGYGIWGGADAIFGSFIVLAVPTNPFTGDGSIFPFTFLICLASAMVATAGLTFALNWYKNRRLPVMRMLNDYPNHVPMMVPMSAAFILALVL